MLDPLSLSIPLSQPHPSKPPGPARRLLIPTDTPGEYLCELDYSSLSDFLTCPRKGENSLVHSREAAKESAATFFGKTFHLAEEHCLRHGFSPESQAEQFRIIADAYSYNPPSPGEYRTPDRLIDVVSQYNRRYRVPGAALYDNWPNTIIQHEGEPFLERPFKMPLVSLDLNKRLPYQAGRLIVPEGNPDHVDETEGGVWVDKVHIVLTGRIDLGLHSSGLLWSCDHKTSSRGGSEFIEAFRLSLQTRLYTLAMREILQKPIAGCIINAVIVRPLTKTGSGTDFERHFFHYSDDLLEDAKRSYIAAASDFFHCLSRGFFPQHARSFKSPCAGCDYASNCTLPFHQRPADLASELYRDVTWSPMDE